MDSTVIMDVSDPNMTLSEIFHLVEKYRNEHPEWEIYLDGDRRAIMAKHQYVQSTLDGVL